LIIDAALLTAGDAMIAPRARVPQDAQAPLWQRLL
jgi:hypothetical protein